MKFVIISPLFISTTLAIFTVFLGVGMVGHPTSQSDRANSAIDKSFSDFARKYGGDSK